MSLSFFVSVFVFSKLFGEGLLLWLVLGFGVHQDFFLGGFGCQRICRSEEASFTQQQQEAASSSRNRDGCGEVEELERCSSESGEVRMVEE